MVLFQSATRDTADETLHRALYPSHHSSSEVSPQIRVNTTLDIFATFMVGFEFGQL